MVDVMSTDTKYKLTKEQFDEMIVHIELPGYMQEHYPQLFDQYMHLGMLDFLESIYYDGNIEIKEIGQYLIDNKDKIPFWLL